ncbi:unnamed protein product [Didymodactylos carnosus]|uniref:RRM domain-containing protein n=1 Tax=Didymodactylos carnosus TaxID=1234261 RepID=A0A815YPH4_9BILA|nr:unnamed protein product [Didymodactylos carnosus]CAF4439052.1 unnamed protein product [Didymodactylos carnosus]
MISYTSTNRSRVKITGLSPNVTAFDLSNQFEITSQLISIPKSQTNSAKWYAWIDGFENEEQAVVFASEWNEAFKHGRIGIRCEIDTATDTSKVHESSITIKSNDKRSQFTHSNRSTYYYESNDDDDDDAAKNRNRE